MSNIVAVSAHLAEMKRINPWEMSFVVLIANLGMMLFGYEVGASSWLVYVIEQLGDVDDDNGDNLYFKIVSDSSVLIGITAGICSLAALCTYVVLLYGGNSIPKGSEIVLASLFYVIGGILQSVSSDMDWEVITGFATLLIGRFIYGIGIALTVHAVPQYVAEVTNSETRGNFGSTVEAMVMVGMTLGFVVGYFVDDSSWTVTFRAAYVLSGVMFIGSWWLPASPIYMLHNNYTTDEIVKSMQFLYPDVTSSAVESLRDGIESEEKRRNKLVNKSIRWLKLRESQKSLLHMFLTPQLQALWLDRKCRRGFYLVLLINVMKVMTGQTVILYYLSTIFGNIVSSNTLIEDYAMVYIGMRAVVAVIMISMVHLAGRRVWMLLSTFLLFASQFIVFFGFSFGPVSLEMVIFVCGFGYEIGLGSVAYLVASEVVPFYVRSTANAAANCALFTLYFATVFLFPIVVDTIGMAYVFLITSGFSLLALVFVFFFLPETRGIPIEEASRCIDEKFDDAPKFCVCFSENGDNDNDCVDDDDDDDDSRRNLTETDSLLRREDI